MLRKGILYILLFFTVAGLAQDKKGQAPKVTPVRTLLKDARSAIKNKKDQKNKEKALFDALKRDDLTNEERAEIYFMASALEHSLNDQENLKAYLKQKYDTANYYNTMLLSTQYALKCDSLDTLPDEHGKVKAKFRSKNRDQILLYRPNIYLGGRYFLRKGDYKKTFDFMSTYSDFPNQALISSHPKIQNDTLLRQSNYYSVLSAYNSKNPQNALLYIDRAIQYADSAQGPVLQEYKVRCLLDTKQQEAWLWELQAGVRAYPKHDYFFANMAKYYEDNGMTDECIALADSMLEHVQDATIYWYSKSLMYLHKENWLKSAEMAEIVLQREPEHINALYNMAVSYVNEASDCFINACTDVRDPRSKTDREHVISLYRKALHPSEEIKRLRPDAVNTWAPLLYRIYLNLNMGAEFAEMEKEMKALRK